jgi:PleD family two-component response regulator
VARALVEASLRPADLVARYGGEEFVVLLPKTPRSGAEHVARSILQRVSGLGIAHAASPTAPHVSVSIGVACYDEDSACWVPPSADSRFGNEGRPRCCAAELVAAADKALYSAKHAGRAQARLLDIGEATTPELARDVAPA